MNDELLSALVSTPSVKQTWKTGASRREGQAPAVSFENTLNEQEKKSRMDAAMAACGTLMAPAAVAPEAAPLVDATGAQAGGKANADPTLSAAPGQQGGAGGLTGHPGPVSQKATANQSAGRTAQGLSDLDAKLANAESTAGQAALTANNPLAMLATPIPPMQAGVTVPQDPVKAPESLNSHASVTDPATISPGMQTGAPGIGVTPAHLPGQFAPQMAQAANPNQNPLPAMAGDHFSAAAPANLPPVTQPAGLSPTQPQTPQPAIEVNTPAAAAPVNVFGQTAPQAAAPAGQEQAPLQSAATKLSTGVVPGRVTNQSAPLEAQTTGQILAAQPAIPANAAKGGVVPEPGSSQPAPQVAQPGNANLAAPQAARVANPTGVSAASQASQPAPQVAQPGNPNLAAPQAAGVANPTGVSAASQASQPNPQVAQPGNPNLAAPQAAGVANPTGVSAASQASQPNPQVAQPGNPNLAAPQAAGVANPTGVSAASQASQPAPQMAQPGNANLAAPQAAGVANPAGVSAAASPSGSPAPQVTQPVDANRSGQFVPQGGGIASSTKVVAAYQSGQSIPQVAQPANQNPTALPTAFSSSLPVGGPFTGSVPSTPGVVPPANPSLTPEMIKPAGLTAAGPLSQPTPQVALTDTSSQVPLVAAVANKVAEVVTQPASGQAAHLPVGLSQAAQIAQTSTPVLPDALGQAQTQWIQTKAAAPATPDPLVAADLAAGNLAAAPLTRPAIEPAQPDPTGWVDGKGVSQPAVKLTAVVTPANAVLPMQNDPAQPTLPQKGKLNAGTFAVPGADGKTKMDAAPGAPQPDKTITTGQGIPEQMRGPVDVQPAVRQDPLSTVTADSTLAQQISSRIESAVQQGHTSLHLQLNPKELGNIDVHMVTTGQALSVTLTVQKADTGSLLEKQLDELRASLTQAGVHQVSVNVGHQASSGQPGGNFNGQSSPHPYSGGGKDEDTAQTKSGLATQPTHSGTDTRVDYRI